MKFPLIIMKEQDSDYNAMLPDFPGCFITGRTVDDVLGKVQGCVETWMYDESPELFPIPSPIESVMSSEDAQDATLFLVEVDTGFLDKEVDRIHMSLPRYALKNIDHWAKQFHMTRSAFLVRAATEYARQEL